MYLYLWVYISFPRQGEAGMGITLFETQTSNYLCRLWCIKPESGTTTYPKVSISLEISTFTIEEKVRKELPLVAGSRVHFSNQKFGYSGDYVTTMSSGLLLLFNSWVSLAHKKEKRRRSYGP